jgi:pyruvate/2-oxoglutarate/acetoin dehydrogenase E1 component
MPTVLESLNNALHQALAADDHVVLLGEDLLDPYGGAFKVTRGLSTAFPGRVMTTPVSEAGMVGLAAGMALRGLRPVVEIMFGDFLTLAADQLINHAAKFRWMYNDQVRLPLVVRTPMGGRRGYGPTHSQTLEKLFLGVPGMRVLAPSALIDPGELLCRAILDGEDPTLFVENKLLYQLPVHRLPVTPGDAVGEVDLQYSRELAPGPAAGSAPVCTAVIRGAPPPSLTIAAYGYTAELALQAMQILAYEHEVFCELVVPSQLAPFDRTPLVESALHTGRLLVVEEGARTLGWGAEVLASCAEGLGPGLRKARRLGALDVPIPAASSLEEAVLPGVEDLIREAKSMV